VAHGTNAADTATPLALPRMGPDEQRRKPSSLRRAHRAHRSDGTNLLDGIGF